MVAFTSSGSAYVMGGASFGLGHFRNLTSGSSGYFWTVAAGAGLDGGFGLFVPSTYRSASTLSGANFNVTGNIPLVAGGFHFQTPRDGGELVGETFAVGRSIELGFTTTISGTGFFGCTYKSK